MVASKAKTRRAPYTKGAHLARIIFILLALAVIAFVGHRLSKRIRWQIVASKLAVTDSKMKGMADAQTKYQAALGRFMPWSQYPEGPRLDIENWGMNNMQVFQSFLRSDIDDPFNPGKTLLFWSDRTGWTVWSVGPNRESDLPREVYANPDPATRYQTAPYLYDPSNGLVSKGDLILIYRPAPIESTGDAGGAS